MLWTDRGVRRGRRVVIFWGCVKESAALAAVGGIPAALFWPALTAARAIRKENMLLRFLEIPLGLATTAAEAADELRKAFAAIIKSDVMRWPGNPNTRSNPGSCR